MTLSTTASARRVVHFDRVHQRARRLLDEVGGAAVPELAAARLELVLAFVVVLGEAERRAVGHVHDRRRLAVAELAGAAAERDGGDRRAVVALERALAGRGTTSRPAPWLGQGLCLRRAACRAIAGRSAPARRPTAKGRGGLDWAWDVAGKGKKKAHKIAGAKARRAVIGVSGLAGSRPAVLSPDYGGAATSATKNVFI